MNRKIKYKILYVIPHLEKSGPVEQLRSLIKYLDRERYTPEIITLFKERENSNLFEFSKKLNVPVTQINGSRKIYPFLLKTLKRKIIEKKPTLVHSESVLTDILISKLKLEIPWMSTLHNFPKEDLIGMYGKIVGKVLCTEEVKANKKANMVVACSQSLHNKYLKEYNIKSAVIHNGIDFSLWRIVAKSKAREKLGLPKNKNIIISTGALIERKNPMLIINGFKKAQIDNSLLLMLGSGDLVDSCKAVASENVIFLGKVKNVNDYLNAADVFVSASRSEGLPYAVLEAAYCNIPLILSNIPEHCEITSQLSTDSYRLFDVNDEADFVSKLCDVSGRKKISDNNLSKFDAEEMSKKYQKIYKELYRNN